MMAQYVALLVRCSQPSYTFHPAWPVENLFSVPGEAPLDAADPSTPQPLMTT